MKLLTSIIATFVSLLRSSLHGFYFLFFIYFKTVNVGLSENLSTLSLPWAIETEFLLIISIHITRTVWETVRRITNEILGVKGLRFSSLTCNRKVPSLHHSWFFAFFSLKWQVSGLSTEKCYVNITQACRVELCHKNSTSSTLLYSAMKTKL